MINNYAKIQDGIVLLIQVCADTDTFDPAFTWIVVDGKSCQDGSPIQPGCLYDGTNFNPAGS